MSESEGTMFPAAADNLDQSSNWLVGVIDSPQTATQAAEALLQAGFAKDDVLLLHGPEALKRMEAKDEHRGPLGWAHKAVANIVTDAAAFQETYAKEASAGHTILNIHSDDDGWVERGRAILEQYGAHYIKRFGPWTITDLS